MALQQRHQQRLVARGVERAEVSGDVLVAEAREAAVEVVDEGEAAGHSRAEVLARAAEDDDGSACVVVVVVVLVVVVLVLIFWVVVV